MACVLDGGNKMKKEAVDVLLHEIPFPLVLIYADEYRAGSPAQSLTHGGGGAATAKKML
jgi:hypothetical protein